MTEANRVFIEDNRSHYDTYIRAGFIKNLSGEIRNGMLNVIREEYNPGYLCCMHCPADIISMICYLYTQYDQQRTLSGQ